MQNMNNIGIIGFLFIWTGILFIWILIPLITVLIFYLIRRKYIMRKGLFFILALISSLFINLFIVNIFPCFLKLVNLKILAIYYLFFNLKPFLIVGIIAFSLYKISKAGIFCNDSCQEIKPKNQAS